MEKSKEKKKKGKVVYVDPAKQNFTMYLEASCPFCGFSYKEMDEAWMEPYCPHCGAELVW